jgi:KaiC/GvpD/RAD55 family RecA-like ATPase
MFYDIKTWRLGMAENDRQREDLIEELGNLVKKHTNSGIAHKLNYTMKRWELELVADYIIEDRKRTYGWVMLRNAVEELK